MAWPSALRVLLLLHPHSSLVGPVPLPILCRDITRRDRTCLGVSPACPTAENGEGRPGCNGMLPALPACIALHHRSSASPHCFAAIAPSAVLASRCNCCLQGGGEGGSASCSASLRPQAARELCALPSSAPPTISRPLHAECESGHSWDGTNCDTLCPVQNCDVSAAADTRMGGRMHLTPKVPIWRAAPTPCVTCRSVATRGCARVASPASS